jgi:hypothetical protein
MNSAGPQELPYDAQIAALTEQLEEAREKAAAIEAQLDWWQRGRDLYGSPKSNGNVARGAKPTLAQAIVRLMSESDRPEWTAGMIMEGLRSHGWMPNGSTAKHAVRTKLAKLARGEDAVLQRVHHGIYTLRAPISVEEP